MNKYLEKAVEWHGSQMYGDKPYRYHLEMVTKTYEGVYGCGSQAACLCAIHDVKEDCQSLTLEEIRDWLIHQPELDLYDVDFNILPALDAITKCEGESRSDYLIRVKGSRLAKQVKIADAMSNLRQNIIDKNLKRAAYYQDTLDKLLEV